MRKNNRIYDFLKKCEMPPRESLFWLSMNFMFCTFFILLGRIIIRFKLNRKDSFVMLASRSMGDVLLLYRSLAELQKINSFSNMTLIAEPSFYKPITAVGIDNVRIIPFWQIMAIDKAILFRPEKYPNIVIGTPWYLLDMQRLNPDATLNALPNSLSAESAQKLFDEPDMKGNSVILAPYEQSFAEFREKRLPVSFWERLASALKQEGYYVFTNCNGVTEAPIKGTRVFFPPLAEVSGAVEYAGYCVSNRSGFTDWISGARLNREVVLYPSPKYYGLFSVKSIWGKEGVLEKVYDLERESLDEITEEILEFIKDERAHETEFIHKGAVGRMYI